KGTMGLDAWRAHTVQRPDGRCPAHSPVPVCDPVDISYFGQDADDDKDLWCGGVPAGDWPAVCGRKAPWDR
ncbi:hypothetical protein, partial [Kitasatospora sp. MBT63]|uniref:hypothetical protein n=1 Tax=Kitasatospora sp. MBT63 TaxID=1444768 RepID=UPI001313F1E8